MSKFISSSALSGLCIGLGIVFAALILNVAAGRMIDQKRFVSVKGLSEREVQADVVTWPILHKEVGNDLMQLSRSMDEKRAIIKKFLMNNGIEEKEISASAPEIIDQQAERYMAQPASYRYIITSVLTVTSNKIDLVRDLLSRQGDLLKQGVALASGDYRFQPQFNYTKLNEIKVEMIKEASANARVSAEQFALDSGSELGKIRDASQGQISITDRDPNTPYIKQVRVVTSVSYFLND